MPQKTMRTSLEGLLYVWNDDRPGLCWKAENGVWHLSRSCDLQVILFYLNLTDWDKRFLQSLKISIHY